MDRNGIAVVMLAVKNIFHLSLKRNVFLWPNIVFLHAQNQFLSRIQQYFDIFLVMRQNWRSKYFHALKGGAFGSGPGRRRNNKANRPPLLFTRARHPFKMQSCAHKSLLKTSFLLLFNTMVLFFLLSSCVYLVMLVGESRTNNLKASSTIRIMHHYRQYFENFAAYVKFLYPAAVTSEILVVSLRAVFVLIFGCCVNFAYFFNFHAVLWGIFEVWKNRIYSSKTTDIAKKAPPKSTLLCEVSETHFIRL